MGNVQCGTPSAFENDLIDSDDLSASLQVSQKVSCYAPQDADTGDEFIKVHVKDRQGKCILEQGGVTQALAKQAEALILREIEAEDASLMSSEFSDDDDGLIGSDVSTAGSNAIMPGVPLASTYSRSDLAPSAITTFTTDTAKTRRAGNRHSRRSITEKRGPDSPPKVLGTDFDPKDSLHADLQKAINRVSGEEERKRLGSLSRTFALKAGCYVPEKALSKDVLSSQYGDRVCKLMTTLHLKIHPQCTQYFRKYFSRLLPDSPIARAFSESVHDTNLCPPRRSNRKSPPELLPCSSDSSASSTAEPEFFEGPQSSPVRLLVTDTVFMDLAVTGSLGLVNRRKRFADKEGSGRKLILPPDHYLVLLNRRSGAPLAVCALKATSSGPPVFRIYATKRRVFGQRPASTTRTLGLDWTESFPLFTWAEIVTEGRYPDLVKYSIYMASGNDGRFEEVPSYLASQSSVGSPEIRMVGRTDREHSYTGCAVLSLSRDEDSAEEDDLFFRLSISKGIDPALLICFAAFVDESMEKTMIVQCQSATENFYRSIAKFHT